MMDENNKNRAERDSALSLLNLIDPKKWQSIQDIFSSITDIGLRTIDAKGQPVTVPSGEPKLCREIIKISRLISETCVACLPTFLGGKAVVDRNMSFVCPPGFHNFIAPLTLKEGKILGYVILGPVILVSRKKKEQYAQIAETLNVNPETFWEGVLEIRVLSFHRVQTTIELIKDICSYILSLAAEKKTVQDEIQDMNLERSVRLAEFLDKFLTVALQISGADIGSIMILNEETEELSILVSKGLKEDVIKKTRVKVGEGISGTAVKEKQSFLIDETHIDNRIKPYLNRPQIKSSMVLPIHLEGKSLGVMNLGTLTSSPIRFNQDNVSSMNEFIDLATLTFNTPLRAQSRPPQK